MSVIKSIVFWLGMILLIVDLATYYTAIKLYFTTLGIVLLAVSLIILIASYFIKSKK
jgi:hypothetical protein